MKKTFCDICGAPADEGSFDKSQVAQHAKASHPNDQCQVLLRPVFSFINNPTGYTGPPDLCRKCMGKLVNDLRVQFEDGPGMATFKQQAA